MLASRDEQRHGEQADDWLARGWNPFLPQKSDVWGRTPAIEMMLDSGRWHWDGWIKRRKERLAEQALETFGDFSNPRSAATAARLLARCASMHGGHGFDPLIVCLDDWKIPPNIMAPKAEADSAKSAPALFAASPWGARQLLARGADPSLKSSAGATLWESWARRHMRGALTLSELDDIAKVDPPTRLAEPGCRSPLGVDAIWARASGVASRLAAAGVASSVFGARDAADLPALLCHAIQGGDTPELVAALGSACGWPAIAEALWVAPSPAKRDSYHLGAGGGRCPARMALATGSVAVLGLLERSGALDLRRAEALMLPIWREPEPSGRAARRPFEKPGRGYFDSAAWLWARLPDDESSKKNALALWM